MESLEMLAEHQLFVADEVRETIAALRAEVDALRSAASVRQPPPG